MESTGISREQADLEVKPAIKASFWRGFCAALLVVFLVVCYWGWREFRWYRGHTTPSIQEVSKLAALLNLQDGQDFLLLDYEFQYTPIGPDKVGTTAVLIRRTSISPSWDDMLTSWTVLKEKPTDLNRIMFRSWAGKLYDAHRGQIYYRWVTENSFWDDVGGAYGVNANPVLCIAFLPDSQPGRLCVILESELMFPNVWLRLDRPEGVLDWTRNAWDKS